MIPPISFVVGITGPSGCGKSTLAHGLVQNIPGATLFPEDPKYFLAPKATSYRDQAPESETPAYVDWDLYVLDLKERLTQGGVWVVDHFLLLHDERVVRLLDAVIHLDPSSETSLVARDICRERRIMRQPNRSLEEQEYLRQYYNDHVWPCYLRYTHGPALLYRTQNPSRTLAVDCLVPTTRQILMSSMSFFQEHVEKL